MRDQKLAKRDRILGELSYVNVYERLLAQQIALDCGSLYVCGLKSASLSLL